MRKSLKKHNGVTLVELLIAMAVFSIVSLIAGSFLINGLKFFKLTTAKGEIQRDARVCIDHTNRNLRQAVSTTVKITRYNNTQPPCSMVEFTTIKGSQYRYYQLNNKLYSATRPDAASAWQERAIGENLRNAVFAYPSLSDDKIISISFCFEKGTYEGKTKTLQLSVEKIRIMN